MRVKQSKAKSGILSVFPALCVAPKGRLIARALALLLAFSLLAPTLPAAALNKQTESYISNVNGSDISAAIQDYLNNNVDFYPDIQNLDEVYSQLSAVSQQPGGSGPATAVQGAIAPLSDGVAPNIITSSVYVIANDGSTSVDVVFYDNFGEANVLPFDDFDYVIFKGPPGGGVLSSGTIARGSGGGASITLDFTDPNTPKTISAFSNGEFSPSYQIDLQAIVGIGRVSAMADVYILPPPINIGCTYGAANAVIGAEHLYVFQVCNLLQDYTVDLKIMRGGALIDSSSLSWDAGGEQPSGNFDIIDGTWAFFQADKENGLYDLIGGEIIFTPDTPGVYSIVVTATNPNETPVSYTKTSNVPNPEKTQIVKTLFDGLTGDALILGAGEGDYGEDVIYGILEKEIASLTGGPAGSPGNNYDSTNAYAYLKKMVRPLTLGATVPPDWGGMHIAASAYLEEINGSIDIYQPVAVPVPLNGAFSMYGNRFLLGWDNVPTSAVAFYFVEDYLDSKVYVFRLEGKDGNPVTTPLSLTYETPDGTIVTKTTTPDVNGNAVIYEPNQISGGVYIAQGSGSAAQYAMIYKPESLRSSALYASDGRIVVSPHNDPNPNPGDYEWALGTNVVRLASESEARFRVGWFDEEAEIVLNYGLLDRDGAFIDGTDGRISFTTDFNTPEGFLGDFELPFGVMREHPGAVMMLEFTYDHPVYTINRGRVRSYTYSLEQLERLWRDDTLTMIRLGEWLPNNYVHAAFLNEPSQRSLIGGSEAGTKGLFTTWTFTEGTQVQSSTVDVLVRLPDGGDIDESPVEMQFAYVDIGQFEINTIQAESITRVNFPFSEHAYVLIRFSDWDTMAANRRAKTRICFTLSSDDPEQDGVWTEDIAYLFQDNEEAREKEEALKALVREDSKKMISGDQIGLDMKNADMSGNNVGNNQITDALGNFDIKIPTGLPFTFEVMKQGNEYQIKGIISYNFLPGGPAIDMVNSLSNLEVMFNSIRNVVKNNLNGLDRGLTIDMGLPSAFAGVRGYIMGKAVVSPYGVVDVSFVEGGVIGELSGKMTGQASFVIGNCGFRIEGLLSTGIYIGAPTGDTKNSNSLFKIDVGNETRMRIGIAVWLGLGLDLYVVSATAGIEGSASVDFRHKSVYRPYMSSGDEFLTGMQVELNAGITAYLRFKLLFVSWTERYDIWKINKKWLIPNDPGNPYHLSHTTRQTALFAPVYRNLIQAPADALLTGIDDSAQARYYGNGAGVIYKDMGNPEDVMDDRIMSFASSSPGAASSIEGTATPAYGFDASTGPNGQAAAAWETIPGLDFDPDDIAGFNESEALQYISGLSEIMAGVYNGTSWDVTRLTDNRITDMRPKTATNGVHSIVVWSRGVMTCEEIASNDGELQIPAAIDIAGQSLMFARHDSNSWSNPATLLAASGEAIVDYAAAVDAGGNAIIAAVGESGKVYIIRVAGSGSVSIIDNDLPPAAGVSLVFDGASFTLACFDPGMAVNTGSDVRESEPAMTLYKLDGNGILIGNTRFSCVPEGISGNFKLFRDWSVSGAQSAVLVWAETTVDADGNPITHTYASRIYDTGSGGTLLLSAPIIVAQEVSGASVVSFDAYISGKDIKLLTVYGASDGSAYLAEASAELKNTIKARPGTNDLYTIMPGTPVGVNFLVTNNGFLPIKSISVSMGGKSAGTANVNVLPSGETTVSAPYVPTRTLPYRLDYTIVATFIDDSSAEISSWFPLQQTDIAVQGELFELEDGKWLVKAHINNVGPFSLKDKVVYVGLYTDALGGNPIVAEKQIIGSSFEETANNSTYNVPVDAEFIFSLDDGIPPIIYIVAKTYEDQSRSMLVPDRDSANNTAAITVAPLAPLAATYDVTVIGTGTGATGSGSYAQGATVNITAGTPPTGYKFKEWTSTSSGVSFANASNVTTTFTMPANAVSVTAAWTAIDDGGDGGGGGGDDSGTGGSGAPKPTVPDGDDSDTIDTEHPPLDAGEQDTNPFTDVDAGAWYFDAVQYMFGQGLMIGVADNRFGVDTELSRAMIATVLYRHAGEPGVAGLENPFSDVPEGQWYTDAIKWAYANEIVLGYGNGRFGPNDPATKEQLAALIYRTQQRTGKIPPDILMDFEWSDWDNISQWAKGNVNVLTIQGVFRDIPGPEGKFGPQTPATRTEAASILFRYLTAVE